MLLDGRVVFLTGGSDGIGWHCAQAYAAEGARVAIVAHDPQRVAQAADSLGADHLGVTCDVSKAEQVERAISETLHRFGKLNVIHNNAGVPGPSKSLHETSEREWDDVLNTNLKSVYLTARFGYAALRETRGCIVNTSSLAGVIGQEAHAAYTATKGGMNALTKSMALDYANDGVRVNAVCPAGVWTPMLRQWASEQPNPATIAQYLDDIHPLGPCPEGDVIADACVFLASDRARFITGHIMHVSGGAELGYRRTESKKPRQS